MEKPFNHPEASPKNVLPASILHRIEQHAYHFPDKTAFTFLADGDDDAIHITYFQLYEKVSRFGNTLKESLPSGERVVLYFSLGIDFIIGFLGCLHAGIVPVPSIQPRTRHLAERLGRIYKDAGAKAILTHLSLLKKDEATLRQTGAEIFLLDTDKNTGYSPLTCPEIDPHSTAFIQYTSGSTSAPKGVVISHANVLENIEQITQAFHQNHDSVIVNWLPFYHDMGLIGGVLVPLYLGATSILLSPSHFVQKPVRWLRAISKYKATTSGGPNFSYELCVNSIKKEDVAGLDLSSWATAFVGAETIRISTVEKFSRLFKDHGFSGHSFQPCYGMAEATLLISAATYHEPVKTVARRAEPGKHEQTIVCCGMPVGCQVAIVDNDGNEKYENEIGEIVIQGRSVSSGYWNKPELNTLTFKWFTAQGNGPYFKTGDLGLIRDGALYITGRIKDLIIINGKNYYPGDIEDVVSINQPFLVQNGCAAFSVEDNDREELAIVAEINNTISKADFEHIFSSIRKIVSEEFQLHVNHICLIKKGTIPKTTSGKIQRYQCRNAFVEKKLQVFSEWSVNGGRINTVTNNANIATGDPTIEKLVYLLKEVSHISKVDIDDNIFSIGVNSIMLTQYIMLINEEFETEFLIEDIFNYPTIRKIAHNVGPLRIENLPALETEIVETASLTEYTPTINQQSIWFDHYIKNSNSYNIPVMVNAAHLLEVDLIGEIYQKLLSEHDILRTVFRMEAGSLSAIIKPAFPYQVLKIDLTDNADELLLADTVRKIFDLENGPLFRICVVRQKSDEDRLLIVSHQIVADGTTLKILAEEILNRYNDPAGRHAMHRKVSLSPYHKFASEIQELLKSPFVQEARHYWHNELAAVPPFTIQADHIVYYKKDKTSNSVIYSLDGKTVQKIKIACAQSNYTVYMFMLSAFFTLLYKYTGKNDILIGIPVSGRQRKGTANMLGAFINTVFIKAQISSDHSFRSLLKSVAEKIVYGLKYQDYPVGWLTNELNPEVEDGFPFSSVFFNGLNFLSENDHGAPFQMFSGDIGIDINTDINCYLAPTLDGLDIRIDYRSAKYKRSTIEKLLHYFGAIVDKLSNDIDITLHAVFDGLPLNKEEEENIIKLSNGSDAPYPDHETLSSLIEKQVLRTPNNIAVVCGTYRSTYAQFNGKANSLACQLQKLGVSKNDFVVMLMDKALEIPLSMLALMKLGAVFVPMDLNWPLNRINLLIADLNPKLIIYNNGGKIVKIDDKGIASVCIDFMQLTVDPVNPVIAKDLDTPIYGMYTSGTTGLPKCTVNIQKGILNRLLYMNRRYGCSENEVVLLMSKYDYDACVWQIFWPMLNGGKTVVPTTTQEMDLYEIINLIGREGVTFTDFVPSVFNVFIDYIEDNRDAIDNLASLRQLLIGGEAMNTKAIKRFRELLSHVGITNTFGATEASMGTIFYELPLEIEDNIPIGKPIDNVRALILDEQMQLVPFGAVGELYLGGDCLGLGYLNETEKTNAVFVPNPITEIKSKKLYRTGDLVCFLPDGNIRYIGRKDLQVKINGIRVELGEIEKRLLLHKYINEAVVIATTKDDKGTAKNLIAYLGGNPEMDFYEIKEYLEQWLPKYMVPTSFVYIYEFPRIGIGKVDKKALQMMQVKPHVFERTYHRPSTAMEESLLHIWQEVLGDKSFGIDDAFFDIGGDSLKAMQLLTFTDKKLNIHLSLAEIFNNPTIRKQASVLEQKQPHIEDAIIPVRLRNNSSSRL